MKVKERHDNPLVYSMLNTLGIVSVLGFLYCGYALLSNYQGLERFDAALYLVWFGISMLSAIVMRRGDIRGAYALGIATVAITFYDLVRGMATFGGALLGILVMLIIFSYIQTTTPLDETDKRLTT